MATIDDLFDSLHAVQECAVFGSRGKGGVVRSHGIVRFDLQIGGLHSTVTTVF